MLILILISQVRTGGDAGYAEMQPELAVSHMGLRWPAGGAVAFAPYARCSELLAESKGLPPLAGCAPAASDAPRAFVSLEFESRPRGHGGKTKLYSI